MLTLSIDSEIKLPKGVKRNLQDAEWFSELKLLILMEQRKPFKFVHNKSFAVRIFLFYNSSLLNFTTCFKINFLFTAQPPGVPEICRKSLISCPASGGLELFLLGKNFLKDTKIVFQSIVDNKSSPDFWEERVLPDKEFLQQV